MAGRRRRKNSKVSLITSIAAIVILVMFAGLEKLGVTDIINEYAAPVTTTVNSDAVSGDGALMTVHFIDVGQGDCALYISDDETMLVDSGEAEYAQTVINALDSYGVTKLDYVVASHAHTDHMGAMAEIINEIPVKNIIISEPCEDSAGTSSYGNFLDAVDESGADIIIAEPEYTFTLGFAQCDILAPFEINDEENNNSVVMHITAGTTSILTTGDAEKAVEKDLIEKYPDLSTTILKVGHHGSKTSSCEEFISAIGCETGIISVGADNTYGHPTEQVISTLDKYGVEYYRTDIEGTVTVECFADRYTVK